MVGELNFGSTIPNDIRLSKVEHSGAQLIAAVKQKRKSRIRCRSEDFRKDLLNYQLSGVTMGEPGGLWPTFTLCPPPPSHI